MVSKDCSQCTEKSDSDSWPGNSAAFRRTSAPVCSMTRWWIASFVIWAYSGSSAFRDHGRSSFTNGLHMWMTMSFVAGRTCRPHGSSRPRCCTFRFHISTFKPLVIANLYRVNSINLPSASCITWLQTHHRIRPISFLSVSAMFFCSGPFGLELLLCWLKRHLDIHLAWRFENTVRARPRTGRPRDAAARSRPRCNARAWSEVIFQLRRSSIWAYPTAIFSIPLISFSFRLLFVNSSRVDAFCRSFMLGLALTTLEPFSGPFGFSWAAGRQAPLQYLANLALRLHRYRLSRIAFPSWNQFPACLPRKGQTRRQARAKRRTAPRPSCYICTWCRELRRSCRSGPAPRAGRWSPAFRNGATERSEGSSWRAYWLHPGSAAIASPLNHAYVLFIPLSRFRRNR